MNRLGAQLAPLAMAEFREMQENLSQQGQRFHNLFRHARPGLIAIVLGQANNAEVVIDIGPSSGADRIGYHLDKLENIAKKYQLLVSERNKVESRHKAKRLSRKTPCAKT